PERPHLDQLRKQAKELLTAFRAGDAAAGDEVDRFERRADAATFRLADAQRVLARAYGFATWPALKQRVEVVAAVEPFCQAVRAGDVRTVREMVRAVPLLVPECTGEPPQTSALHLAVFARDVDMTRALLDLGFDPHVGIWPHRPATTPYVIARERGYDEI